MKNKNTALKKFYSGALGSGIMLSIGSLICTIFIPIETIKWTITNNSKALYLVFGIIFFIVITIFSIYSTVKILLRLLKILKDMKAIKNNNYISIEGKVIKFVKNIDLETGRQNNDMPIVEIVGTNGRVQLYVLDKVKIGETYIFHYLENSKIAEVVEKVENVNDAGNDM